jgi:LmbE family N-acetylglucosaminyl deacetylase
MIQSAKKVMVLAPHTDDGEFGCGGSIARLIEEGKEVFYVAFSICEESVPEGLPKDILQTELEAATKVLGLAPENVISFRYPVRKFNYVRQEILEDIIKLRKEISPDLIFIPSLNDIHQDHKTIAEEGVRAFKNNTLLSYELLWNVISFEHTCFVHLKEEHVNLKIKAVQAYESQNFRVYSSDDFLKSQARMRGMQVGGQYAEVFEVVRLNIKC